ncbi:MBL fold metallo-hydrolase [Nocardioides nitrophenolicus]|uniref:MBL fold metallo-hydrolase n=1 Tax=Nocardioides nitrophenolicus TaxID=60489 RepID=UPI00195EA856|nr:MBL fold metallo-hydrolase [Nocardioides nitrophenolicus]MBM7517477.1 glyoxylase-like metal-dependent hydrolase (beta-lactamase superfamily II) [Nocardioides nitrophenolicus]
MSIPVSQQHAARYRAREVAGPSLVGAGVWAVPVPLHGSPLRSIIVYLLETSDGLVLIDAGYEHRTCWESFQASLSAIGHRVEEIRAVLITHNHPDHVGFADRVREASGAEVMLHRDDDFATQETVRGGFLAQLRRALNATGAPEDVVASMYDEALAVAHHAESLRADRVLDGGEVLSIGDVDIEVVHAPGHTYGHLVFVARGMVFTGDTMMAEGPTQLAIPSLPDDDPAGDLLATLDRIAGLGVDVACPAHQFAYREVSTRAHLLAAHHRAEVDEVRTLLPRYDTAWELAPRLDRAKPWAELGSGTRRFALMHTLALIRGAGH